MSIKFEVKCSCGYVLKDKITKEYEREPHYLKELGIEYKDINVENFIDVINENWACEKCNQSEFELVYCSLMTPNSVNFMKSLKRNKSY